MNHKHSIVLVLAMGIAVIAGSALPAVAQVVAGQAGNGNRKTVWSGVYSAAQATRGQAAFQTSCAGCHAPDMEKVNKVARFRGEVFMERWGEDNVESLYSYIRNRMPRSDPGSLTDSVYLDIISRILEANDFPAGQEDLTSDALKNIQIEGKDGPRPLGSFSLVQVVGCLTQGENNSWTLVNAGNPARTPEGTQATPGELEAAATKSLGALTFRLQNLGTLGPDFSLDSHKGHKMFGKGTLMKMPTGDRISVTFMEMISSNCTR